MSTERAPVPIRGVADPNHPTVADVHLMQAEMTSEWWTIALRGVMAILFGVIALAWPGAALGALALLFGFYALADGLFALWSVFRVGRMGKRWWPMALAGATGIVVGLIAIFWPTMAALTLVAFISVWTARPYPRDVALAGSITDPPAESDDEQAADRHQRD